MGIIPADSFSLDPHGEEITRSYATGYGNAATRISDPATVK
jgi:hypothetical protein